jgi:hypothetical protein
MENVMSKDNIKNYFNEEPEKIKDILNEINTAKNIVNWFPLMLVFVELYTFIQLQPCNCVDWYSYRTYIIILLSCLSVYLKQLAASITFKIYNNSIYYIIFSVLFFYIHIDQILK